MPRYPQGSIWRMWDLHVHTPASYEHSFKVSESTHDGDLWEVYVAELEAHSPAVIGVTDYFSLEGYERLVELQSSDGRLPGIKLLPNIELRLDVLADGRRLNYHVIFSDSDEMPIETIRGEFLEALDFPFVGEEPRKLTKANIEELGARLKTTEAHLQDKTDYAAGCENIYLSAKSVRNALEKKPSLFERKYLLVLSGAEWSALPWLGQTNHMRRNLLICSHALFTGNPNDIRWCLGNGDIARDDYEREFGSVKAPLHGSDAHCFARLCKPDLNRHCWVKADPTFEGLLQAVCEPEERIAIGTSPPGKVERGRILKSVAISGCGNWFEDDEPLELNEGLVAIIGGRGTGKTALLDLLAVAVGGYIESDKSFLKKAWPSLEGALVRVEWLDGRATESSISGEAMQESQGPSGIRYLTQSFADQLCLPENEDQLRQQIESVVFQNLPAVTREAYQDFRELRSARVEPIRRQRTHITDRIREINGSICEASLAEKAQPACDEELRTDIQRLREIRAELTKLKEGIQSEETQDQLKQLEKQRKARRSLLSQRAGLEEETNALANLFSKLERRISDDRAFTDKLRAELMQLHLATSYVETVVAALKPDNLSLVLNARQTALGLAIERIEGQLEKVDDRIAELANVEANDGVQRSQIAELEYELQAIRQVIQRKLRERKKVAQAVRGVNELLASRTARVDELVETFHLEKDILESLLEHLVDELEGPEESLFAVSVEIRTDLSEFAEAGDELIDHSRRGRYYNKTARALGEDIVARAEPLRKTASESKDRHAAGLNNFLSDVLALFTETDDGQAVLPEEQLKPSRFSLGDFYNWLYSEDYYAVEYSISFQGIPLESLSPGMKGVALLILFLALDKEDRRPLLIDQPEENLDNRSIYDTLVGYFRAAKRRRQILLVTHNPNLVVNGDAEQVVVASYDGLCAEQSAQICYQSGSLENTFEDPDAGEILSRKGIREHVCQVLEGGTEAFKRRELKYGLAPLLSPPRTTE